MIRIKTITSELKRLSKQAKLLLLSISLFSLADTFLRIFINAFILRKSNNILLVGLYNLGIAFGLPISFYLNGLALKRFKVTLLYFLGAVLQGLVLLPLLFSSKINQFPIFIPGFFFGITFGLYWANRNFLTLKVTKSKSRNFFSGTEISISTIIKVVAPFLIGSFIALGEQSQIYNSTQAYQLLAALAASILIGSGLTIKKINIKTKKTRFFPSFKFSCLWKKVQFISFANGVADGASWFLPILMVLILVGNEKAVGIMTSFSAVLAALITYFISQKAMIKDRLVILTSGLFLEVIAGITFSFLFSFSGVILYYAFHSFAIPLIWASLNPIVMDVIDKENINKIKNNQYNYIFNRELFKDIGMIFGISLFLVLTQTISPRISLRFTPALLALIQMSILFTARSLIKQTKKNS